RTRSGKIAGPHGVPCDRRSQKHLLSRRHEEARFCLRQYWTSPDFPTRKCLYSWSLPIFITHQCRCSPRWGCGARQFRHLTQSIVPHKHEVANAATEVLREREAGRGADELFVWVTAEIPSRKTSGSKLSTSSFGMIIWGSINPAQYMSFHTGWVKLGHSAMSAQCPVCPKADTAVECALDSGQFQASGFDRLLGVAILVLRGAQIA